MNPLRYDVLPTPAGPLVVVVDPDAVGDRAVSGHGAVVASGFADTADIVARLTDCQRDRGADRTDLGPVAAAVADWAAGDLAALDRVGVVQPGGAYQQRAWVAMRAVPAGRTVTYAELAAAAGNPRATRAAGGACARNLVAPFVPCHRILRSDGSLGGYYYGQQVKHALLAHEGVMPGP